MRISLSQKLETRDKESVGPKLTSWSLLLNAPTADQDKATVCYSPKTGSPSAAAVWPLEFKFVFLARTLVYF